MKKQKAKYSAELHMAAPEMLLDEIIGLRNILQKYKENDQRAAYYRKMLARLEYSYMYMLETGHIHEKNIMLEAQVKFLSNQISFLESKLREFSMMRKLIADDTLERLLTANSDHMHLLLSPSLLEKLNAKNSTNGTN